MSLPLILALIAVGSPLEQGRTLYQKGEYGPALQKLLEGLDQPASSKEKAELRIYIGLIQYSYQRPDDARSSFAKALESDPKVELPADAPSGARELFRSLRGEAPKRTLRRRERPPPRGPETLKPYQAQPRPEEDSGPVYREDSEPEGPKLVDTERPPSNEIPLPTWVVLGAGGVAFVAGTVLAVLAASDGAGSLEELDKSTARARFDRAGAESRIAIAAFAASGALVGIAALTLTFD